MRDLRRALDLWRKSGAPAGLSIALVASYAGAATKGFALDHFRPADPGSEWFALDSLDLRGHLRWAAGITGDYAYRPLVVFDAGDDALGPVVKHQLFAHLGGSVVLWERLKLGVSLPVLLVNEGEPLVIGTTALAADSGPGVGDLRMTGEARLYGAYASPFSLALETAAFFPTGRRAAFTSDRYVRAAGDVRIAGDVGTLAYAGSTGLLARAEREVAGAPIGTAWTFAAAMGLRLLERRLLLGPELWGSTVIAPSVSQGVFSKTGTPFELVVGGHYAIEGFRFGLGVGPGFGRGIGTPALRVLAGAEWSPEPDAPPTVPVPPDGDRDGVLDGDDACPELPGPSSARGCPPPSEPVVQAPTPPPAPMSPPVPSDHDADGVPDGDDACPDIAGPPNTDAARNGCPLVEVRGDRIDILERIEFELASAKLKPESDAVLSAVLEVLTAHPEIRRVEVQGHTDSRGRRAKNRELSRARADAVVAWLVGHGVAAARLKAAGFGADRPLTTNATEEGRQTNRRVEFHFLEVTRSDAAKSEQGGTP